VEQNGIDKPYEAERKPNSEVKSEKQLPESECCNYGKIKRLNKSNVRTEADKRETNYDSNFQCLPSSESDAKCATQIPMKLNNKIE
jgi:hypothetical protein